MPEMTPQVQSVIPVAVLSSPDMLAPPAASPTWPPDVEPLAAEEPPKKSGGKLWIVAAVGLPVLVLGALVAGIGIALLAWFLLMA